MDTQGLDTIVFKSGDSILSRFVGLQSELSFKPLYEGAPMFRETLELYERAGFVLSALVPNNAGFFPYLVEMDCVMFRPDMQPPSSGNT
ncbi:MAG: FkbM family methyltransferase, partial [Pseudomonadota bacterium]